MGRALIIVRGDGDRRKAAGWCQKAPNGTRIEYRRSKRSLPQNNLLWARLTDVSEQVEWYGQKLKPEDWKQVFTAALRKARVVPGIDPGTFVVLGLSTSAMDKEEMGLLLDLISAFAAQHGAVLTDEESIAA